MNLAIRGIDAQIAHGDTFHNDRHPDLKADYVIANPPFNDSDWRGELLKEDKRWVYGVPPAGNANYAWVQHFISHLAPTGLAGFVLANGSMSSNQSGEGEIRKGHHRSRPGGLHGRAARPALLLHADSRLSLVPGAEQEERALPRSSRRDALHRRPQDGRSEGPRSPRADRMRTFDRSPALITPGAATRTLANTPTFPDSAKPPSSMKSASTAMCSHRGATSELKPSKTTESRLRKRWSASRSTLREQLTEAATARCRHRRQPQGAWVWRVSGAVLSELCEQIVDCSHSTHMWTDFGAIVLRSQNIRNGRIDLSAPSYTDDAHFQARTRRAVPTEGDLVITREAPMGEVCIYSTGTSVLFGQRMVLLRPNRAKVDSRYLLFALQSNSVRHENLCKRRTGSTVSNLRIPLLEALPIPTPSLLEQRAIAHILGTLDDKIELNLKMNETLETMARALFQSWFVDFDPVRAKAEGRDPGLPSSISESLSRLNG